MHAYNCTDSIMYTLQVDVCYVCAHIITRYFVVYFRMIAITTLFNASIPALYRAFM